MRKLLVSTTALSLSLGSALAADLPSRKEPAYLPPPPPPLWTGFYVGLNAGAHIDGSSGVNYRTAPIAGFDPAALTVGTGVISLNSVSFIGGGQIGYNFQISPNFVAGVEADIQGLAGGHASGSASATAPSIAIPRATLTGVAAATKGLDYLGTVRGRIGWLFTPTLLIYGTGGLAYGGATLTASTAGTGLLLGAPISTSAATATISDTRVGWTAGGGVEWMFWPNWSAKVEYLYYDLGSLTVGAPVATVGVAPPVAGLAGFPVYSEASSRFNGHIARAGVNYHFNWGAAPVVAKY